MANIIIPFLFFRKKPSPKKNVKEVTVTFYDNAFLVGTKKILLDVNQNYEGRSLEYAPGDTYTSGELKEWQGQYFLNCIKNY